MTAYLIGVMISFLIVLVIVLSDMRNAHMKKQVLIITLEDIFRYQMAIAASWIAIVIFVLLAVIKEDPGRIIVKKL